MKKMMIAVLAVLMLCMLTGCAKKPEESNGIMDAVIAGYETLDLREGNTIRVEGEEGMQTVIQVDQASQTSTIARPYVFAEPGIDFYKIEHNEADFSGVFSYTMNLLARMHQSEEHTQTTMLLMEERLPEGKVLADVGFMSLGYVADPLERCEIIFTGLTDTGEGIPILDEVYAFCRFGMMNSNKEKAIMNTLIVNQDAVYAIAQRVHQTGKLPVDVEAWMLRKLGL